jgi:hypothetical protein
MCARIALETSIYLRRLAEPTPGRIGHVRTRVVRSLDLPGRVGRGLRCPIHEETTARALFIPELGILTRIALINSILWMQAFHNIADLAKQIKKSDNRI